jgi:hypothetical protein
VLFVVADKIEKTDRIAMILAGSDMLDGSDKVLVVMSASPDEDLRALADAVRNLRTHVTDHRWMIGQRCGYLSVPTPPSIGPRGNTPFR